MDNIEVETLQGNVVLLKLCAVKPHIGNIVGEQLTTIATARTEIGIGDSKWYG